MSPALPLEEAQSRLLALAQPLPLERVGMEDAPGRYFAEPLRALRTQPAADLSAMDGYAVAEADLAGPWRIVGESAAGHPFTGTIQAGQAVRIATGALVPTGAGGVVLQEDCAREGEMLGLTGTPPFPPGRHIRRRASDYAEGDLLLPEGARIGPAQLALAISAGHKHVPVRRRVRLAIIDSGDELIAPGTVGGDHAPHLIPASNGAMLAALAASLPCAIERLGPVPDDLARIGAALEARAGADVIVTSGGASVGDHDLIRPALAAYGAEIDFWKVAIRPGKPLLVARRGRQIILGLPGNPVSSLVTAYFFLLPLLRRLSGAATCLPSAVRAPIREALTAGGERREFRRALWNGREVSCGQVHDSGALATLAASNCLIDRPAGAPPAAAGDAVSLYLLEGGGIA